MSASGLGETASREVPILGGRPVGQIGIVVRDIDRALDMYIGMWGLKGWNGFVYSSENVRSLSYLGEPADYRMKVAWTGAKPQIELVQSLGGPNIYEDWLERRGEGLHHLGIMVDSIATEVEVMQDAGYQILQAGFGHGLDGDGGFAYIDTEPELGVIIELIEAPARRRPPDFLPG
ncbi:MAG: VOC family protein [Acidimicrobiia bacterium]|nr:VOC family protein [Acidimicrobiia bacterium]MYH05932.1 VOC family protein [Acidimicrobiia bacterium]MYK56367.1 VOC family protein [Acidimicrobiia bacterium]